MSEKPEKNARRVAFEVLNRVESADAYADLLLENDAVGLSQVEAALATELTLGVLRWKLKLDRVIDYFSSVKTRKLEHKVLTALRLGVYQLLFLDRVPPSAAVNESVKLVGWTDRKKAGFVNAVLRKVAAEKEHVPVPSLEADPTAYISAEFSHPEWLVRRWVERLGTEEALALCKANQEVPPKVLRANRLVQSRDELIKGLEGEGIRTDRTRCSPDGLVVIDGRPRPRDPRYYIQEEASQLIPYLLCPAPGERILDACSAPGGKATHIAEIMKDRGSILALDRHASRLKSVEESAKRLGITIIRTACADASGIIEGAGEGFDGILCDAPCSGLGVVRRTPEIKYRRTGADIKRLSETQKSLLSNLSGYVRAGGRLVYSVCTTEPEETDLVIDWFLEGHCDFEIDGAGGFIPGDCAAIIDYRGFVRTCPHRDGMDGFFAARLRKKS